MPVETFATTSNKKRKLRNVISPIDGLSVDESDFEVVSEIFQNCVQEIRKYMQPQTPAARDTHSTEDIKLLDIRTMFDVSMNDSTFRVQKLTILESTEKDLPDSLLRLDALQDLTIASTRIAIPEWLVELPHLQKLTIFLDDDQALPPEVLQFPNLRVLEICGGNRSSFPSESIIKNNTTLEELSISSEIVPDEIGSFTQIKTLRFGSECQFIPASIGNLKENLRTLIFEECHDLSSLPKEIGDLSYLQILRIGACTDLSSLPREIGNLVNLQVLDLIFSSELLELPQIANLKRLECLSLKGCSGLGANENGIRFIESLRDLRYLNLSELANLILPEGIDNLKRLKYLDVSHSRFVSFPSSLRNLQSLEEFHVEGCIDDENNTLRECLLPDIVPIEPGDIKNSENNKH